MQIIASFHDVLLSDIESYNHDDSGITLHLINNSLLYLPVILGDFGGRFYVIGASAYLYEHFLLRLLQDILPANSI